MVKVGDVKDMEGKERHPANPVDECGHITRMQTCHLKSRLKIVVYAVCRKNTHSKLFRHVSTHPQNMATLR